MFPCKRDFKFWKRFSIDSSMVLTCFEIWLHRIEWDMKKNWYNPTTLSIADYSNYFFSYRSIWMKQSDLPELLFQKVYSNSFFVVTSKNSSTIPLNHARFSNSPVSNDDHLRKKEMIMGLGVNINYGSILLFQINKMIW